MAGIRKTLIYEVFVVEVGYILQQRDSAYHGVERN